MYVYLSLLSLIFGAIVFAQPTGGPVGPPNCANSTALVCLAGRTGTSNNPTLSTTTSGTLKGSTAVDSDLNLQAGHATDPGTVVFGSNITSMTDTGQNTLMSLAPGAMTISGNIDFTDFIIGDFAGTNPLTVNDHTSQRRYGFVDSRYWQQASGIGGESGASISNPDLHTWTSFYAGSVIRSNTGSRFNMVNLDIFVDDTFIDDNGGALNHMDSYISFKSEPTIDDDGNQGFFQGGEFVGFKFVPNLDGQTGSLYRVKGLDVNTDGIVAADFAVHGVEIDVENTHADSKTIYAEGTAPSVHVGTFRLGDVTVATQPFEVLGNIKIDNNGATAGELRLDEPSGNHYTAFKAQAQAGNITYTWPSADDAGVLTSDGAGNLSWDAGGGVSTAVLLAGRTTTGNDFVISTSGAQGGSILGSSVAGAPFNLDSGTATVPGDMVLHSAVTSMNMNTQNLANIQVMPQSMSAEGDGLHDIIAIGRDMAAATNATVTLDPSGTAAAANQLGEYLTQGLVDYRNFVVPTSSGYNGGAPSEGDLQMDEYALARSEVIFNTSTGSHFNVRRVRPFIDAITYLDATSGDFNYQENAHISFAAIPSLGPGFTNSSSRYVALQVVPQVGASSSWQITGVNLDYINNDAASWVGIASDITSGDSGNRFLSHTGTAPSVHTGTMHIGASTVATATLDVAGNIELDSGSDSTISVTGSNSLVLEASGSTGAKPKIKAAYTIGSIGDGLVIPLSVADSATFSNSGSILNVFTASEHGIYTVSTPLGGAATIGSRAFVFAPTITTSTSVSDLGFHGGLFYAPQITTSAATTTADGYFAAVTDVGTAGSSTSAGTLTVAEWTSLDSRIAISSNGASTTITNRRGLYYRAPTLGGSGTRAVTNSIAVDVADQTVSTLAAAMQSAMTVSGTSKWHLYLTGTAPSLFGGPIYGSTAADGTLTIQGTANSDPGTILIGGTPAADTETEYAMRYLPTITDQGAKLVFGWDFSPTITNDDSAGAFVAVSPRAFRCGGTLANNAASSVISQPFCLYVDWTLSASGGSGLPFGGIIQDGTIYEQAGSGTTSGLTEFASSPVYRQAGSGTTASTISTAVGYDFTPRISADASDTQTITTLIAFRASDDNSAPSGFTNTGTESVGTYVAFDVASLTPAAGGTAITLRSAGSDDEMRHAGPASIGANAAPLTDAILDLTSTTKGLRLPRVAHGSLPACTGAAAANLGLVVYCTDCNATCSGTTTTNEGTFCGCQNNDSAAWAALE